MMLLEFDDMREDRLSVGGEAKEFGVAGHLALVP
jgi:hypothetical protein